MQHCKVLHVHRALQYHLTLPANIMWSIPKMPLIDKTRVNLSASVCPTPLFMGRNYEVWTSLGFLQPDGISIFQPPNEIRSEPNGGRREGEVNLF